MSDTPTPRTDSARLDENDPYEAMAHECGKMERELAAATKERDDALTMLGVYKLGCEEQKERIRKLAEDAEANAWTVSPAMAQAKIDQLNERIRKLEALGEELRYALTLAVGDNADGWESEGEPVGERINAAMQAWDKEAKL